MSQGYTLTHVIDARILVLQKLLAMPPEPLSPDMADCAVEAAMQRVIVKLKLAPTTLNF